MVYINTVCLLTRRAAASERLVRLHRLCGRRRRRRRRRLAALCEHSRIRRHLRAVDAKLGVFVLGAARLGTLAVHLVVRGAG